MRKFDFTITSKIGMHARPAAMVARGAEKYKSKISIAHEGITLNGKSIMGLIALKARFGDVITITIDGPDEEEAETGMHQVLEDILGEKANENL